MDRTSGEAEDTEQLVHVWCHFESYASPIRVDIHHDAQVFDVVKAAIEAEEVSTTAGRVVVKFNGNKVRPGDAINQYQTSCETPLLLELSEPEGPPTKRSRLYQSFPVPSDASQLSSGEDQMIRDHRVGKHGTHVSLMWKGFAEFITMMKTEAAIPEGLYVSARKLMQVMSKKYGGKCPEKLRKEGFQNTLNFLGPFECEHRLASGSKCDLALVHCGSVCFNIELKNEFASKDPVAQNNLHFVHSHCKREGLDPMLLLSMVSCHYCQAFGAVFGPRNEVLVDPLSDPISVLDVLDDPLDGELKLARLLHTISLTLPKLKAYYSNPHNQSSDRVPYYKQTELQYTKPISTRVWQAKKGGVTVAVKFTRAYSTEVHEFLAAKKMAPQLLDTSEIEGGWIVIEMDYIEGETLHECQHNLSNAQKEHIRSCLRKTLDHMKDSQFVHGDLRAPNIMIRNDDMSSDSPTPIILDFDWAGKETEAKYPSSINKNVMWPTDVIAKGLIKCEHDNKMVNQLFIY